jgi:hypothetical protein
MTDNASSNEVAAAAAAASKANIKKLFFAR